MSVRYFYLHGRTNYSIKAHFTVYVLACEGDELEDCITYFVPANNMVS